MASGGLNASSGGNEMKIPTNLQNYKIEIEFSFDIWNIYHWKCAYYKKYFGQQYI
jgi:hypothetical protein